MDFSPFKALREEWPLVRTAPWSFAAVGIAALAIGFGAASLWWSGTVSTLRERVTLYQDRLQVGSPEQAVQKFADLERQIKELRPRTQRRLTDEQKTKLLTALSPLSKDIKQVLVFADSPESARYAVDFMRVLKQAGISPLGPTLTFSASSEDKGILVGLIDPKNHLIWPKDIWKRSALPA